MSTVERKRRGGTAAANDSYTGVLREATVDATNLRWRLHDQITPGGMSVPNRRDAQNGAFVAATAGGTANALTLDFGLHNPAAYAKFQRFVLEAASNNTGAATLNVGGLGNVGLRKVDRDGAKQELEADDLVAGRIYEVTHDGSHFVVGALAAATGGREELLDAQALTGASQCILVLPSGYGKFKVEIDGLQFSTDTTLTARVSTDGGSNFISTGNYRWQATPWITGTTTAPTSAAGTDEAQFGGLVTSSGGSADNQWDGEILLDGFLVSRRPRLRWSVVGRDNAGAGRAVEGRGIYNAAITANALRLAPAAGNMTGTVRLWGLKAT